MCACMYVYRRLCVFVKYLLYLIVHAFVSIYLFMMCTVFEYLCVYVCLWEVIMYVFM